MHFLIEPLQTHIEVDGKRLKVATSFRLWLLYLRTLREQNPLKVNIALRFLCPEAECVTDALLVEIKKFTFMQPTLTEEAEEEHSMQVQEDILFDIFADEQLIIADFAREYHIDLLEPTLDMHWHRFKILLDNLSDKSAVSARVHLRNVPLQEISKKERAKVRKLKERYAIKSDAPKMTLTQRNVAWKAYAQKRTEVK